MKAYLESTLFIVFDNTNVQFPAVYLLSFITKVSPIIFPPRSTALVGVISSSLYNCIFFVVSPSFGYHFPFSRHRTHSQIQKVPSSVVGLVPSATYIKKLPQFAFFPFWVGVIVVIVEAEGSIEKYAGHKPSYDQKVKTPTSQPAQPQYPKKTRTHQSSPAQEEKEGEERGLSMLTI